MTPTFYSFNRVRNGTVFLNPLSYMSSKIITDVSDGITTLASGFSVPLAPRSRHGNASSRFSLVECRQFHERYTM